MKQEGEDGASDDFIGKIIQILESKLDQLKPELAKKIDERAKAIKRLSELLSELFSVPFWKKPFLPFLEEWVKRKLRRLKWQIPVLEERVEHYQQALVDLKQGIYGPAIRLLKELAFVYSLRGIGGTKYIEMLKLIEELETLKESGEKGPL